MTFVRSASATITTTATGAGTVYAGPFNGHVDAIKVVAAGTTSVADIVVTGNDSGAPIMTKANITKSATTWFYPRQVSNKVADGAVASGVWRVPVEDELIKTVMLAGGDAQSYTITFYVT